MKIISSQLNFNAERKYEEKDITKREVESLESRPTQPAFRRSESTLGKITVRPRLFSNPTDVPPPSSSDDTTPSDPKLAAMKRMLEAMMGKKLKLSSISGFNASANPSSSQNNPQSSTTTPTSSNPTVSRETAPFLSALTSSNKNEQNISFQNNPLPEIPVRRVRITEFNSHYESESTSFNALGSVKTETGESINFKLQLDMKRQFYTENKLQLTTEATLTDPLVVNFSGKPAELTDVKFKFDLNSDGNEEEISWLSSGSGFLVLDKNQDGVVNDGSEMFGPATNNGFEELARLDEDNNGWIDENDTAFENLSVWSGENPKDAQLKSLKESGIGAIAVANAQTEFTVKDQQTQNTLGQIRRTGIYLEENGKAGTIQQLDLAI